MSGPIASKTLSDIFETLTRSDVDAWVATHRIEDLTLDFKRAPKCFEVPDERHVLAKAISGFGNASGGLIVWGVRAVRGTDCVDAAQAVEPIQDPTRFLSNLTSYSGSAVSPTIPGVVHRLLDDSKVALTLVPESDGGPYMANLGLGQYFTRAGSSFIQMEHFQVVDVFNRRHRPDLRVWAEPSGASIVVVGLSNIGRVIAKAPYLELRAAGSWGVSALVIDGNRGWNLLPIARSGNGINEARFGGSLTTVVHPQTDLAVCRFVWRGAPTARGAFELQYAVAAEDMHLTRDTLVIGGA